MCFASVLDMLAFCRRGLLDARLRLDEPACTKAVQKRKSYTAAALPRGRENSCGLTQHNHTSTHSKPGTASSASIHKWPRKRQNPQ